MRHEDKVKTDKNKNCNNKNLIIYKIKAQLQK